MDYNLINSVISVDDISEIIKIERKDVNVYGLDEVDTNRILVGLSKQGEPNPMEGHLHNGVHEVVYKTQVFNNCSFTITTEDRLGLVLDYHPIEQTYNLKGNLLFNTIPNKKENKGVYIIKDARIPYDKARDMYKYYRDKSNCFSVIDDIKSSYFKENNPIIKNLLGDIADTWCKSPYINGDYFDKHAQGNSRLVRYRVYFYISEKEIERRGGLYDTKSDLYVTKKQMVADHVLHHPALTNRLIKDELNEIYNDKQIVDKIWFVSDKERSIYRRMGEVIQEIKSYMPKRVKGIAISRLYLTFRGVSVKEGKEYGAFKDFDTISIEMDKITEDDNKLLRKFGIFMTFQEAREYMSEFEISNNRTKISYNDIEIAKIKKEAEELKIENTKLNTNITQLNSDLKVKESQTKLEMEKEFLDRKAKYDKERDEREQKMFVAKSTHDQIMKDKEQLALDLKTEREAAADERKKALEAMEDLRNKEDDKRKKELLEQKNAHDKYMADIEERNTLLNAEITRLKAHVAKIESNNKLEMSKDDKQTNSEVNKDKRQAAKSENKSKFVALCAGIVTAICGVAVAAFKLIPILKPV